MPVSKHHFRGQRVYLSGDLLVYYEHGNPKKFVVPDAFAVKGVDPRSGKSIRFGSRAKPDTVIETTS